MEKERKVIADRITRGRDLLSRLNKKLTEFRSDRKKSAEGIEAKMLNLL